MSVIRQYWLPIVTHADNHGPIQELRDLICMDVVVCKRQTSQTHTHTQQTPDVTPGQLVRGAEAVGFMIEAPYKLRARERTDWI